MKTMFKTMRAGLLLLLLATSAADAQWRTETFDLKGGWTAIHPMVDAGDLDLDVLLGTAFDIEEVWRWNPGALDPIVLGTPASPVVGAEWSVWKRDQPGESTMRTLMANRGYLIKAREAAPDFTLSIKGKVVMPEATWRKDGLNLVGLPAATSPAPKIDSYLAPSRLVGAGTQIFSYFGGPITNNPVRLQNTALVNLVRGRAYWINTGRFSDYYGPVKVQVSRSMDGMDFGSQGSTHTLLLTNRTDRAQTVTITPLASETDRAGSSLDPVPLLERVFDPQAQAFTYPALGGPVQVQLAAGETRSKVLVLDRAALSGPNGTEHASVLQVTDSDGLSRVEVPVSATVAGLGGLWIGEALINRVQNQLQQFQRDGDGNYLYDGSGQRIPLAGSGNNTLNATAQTFPVRLIVHVDGAGQAKLLSSVFAGPIATPVEGAVPAFGVATVESLLDTDSLAKAVRITSVHFPLDLNLNLGGTLGAGGSLTGAITLAHDAKDNPFIHAYHPDHDNLDARFENSLPAGAESHSVNRALTLAFDSASPDGSPAWGTQLLTGTYTEEITGLHKNSLSVDGAFFLRRLSDDEILHTP